MNFTYKIIFIKIFFYPLNSLYLKDENNPQNYEMKYF